jgi:predicted CoA-binding protein
VYGSNTSLKGKVFELNLLMENKKTIVLGASANPARYSNLAVKKLSAYKHPVIAIGRRKGSIGEVEINVGEIPVEGIDTITLYLNAFNQKQYYNYILSLKPRRIIFNPGAENEELAVLAEQQGIKAQEACTLVLLSTGQY